MTAKIAINFSLSLLCIILLFSLSNRLWAFPDGPQDGVAGEPPSNSTCNQGGCHSSFALNSGGGTLSLSGVPFNNNNYTPGQTYDLTVNLRHVGKSRWGFELTVLGSNNNLAGTIIVTDPTNTQLSDKYLKHTLSGAFFNPDQSPGWNFQWKAPNTSIPVTFYVSGNAANGDNSSGGDVIYNKSFPLSPIAIAFATTSQANAISPVVADGISTSTITITVRDSSGNPISGKNVAVSATGMGNTITQPSSPTNPSGQTTATIKSTKAETKTITATVDAISIQTTVTFIAGPVSTSTSTISAASTSATADNTSAITVTVTLKDANGNAASGKNVTISATGAGNTLTQPASPADSNGRATATIRSTKAETKTISVIDTTDNISLTNMVTVIFTAGSVSASASTITASPTAAVSDGVAVITVTITLKDANGNAVSEKNVTISATGTGNTLAQPASPADSNGRATATIKSTKAETKTISATNTTDNINLTNTVSVTFFSLEPPVVTLIDTTLMAMADTAKLFKLKVTSSNIISAGNVKLVYKSGEQAFTSITMFDDGAHSDGAANDGVWGNVLTASLVTLKGLAVYFTATDDRGNLTDTTILPDGTKINQATPANVEVIGDATSPAIPVWKSAADWTIISFPVTLPNVDPAVVFAELGAVETNWEAYQFNGGADYDRAIRIARPSDPRDDIEKFTSIGSGKAAWIFHDKTAATSISVKGAKSLDPTKVFAIKVNSGWNQMGNPFMFSIPWNNAIKFGITNNVANAVGVLTAAANNQIARPPIIYLRSGTGYIKISAETTPSVGTVSGNLEPWKGYWFLSKTDGWLFIDPNQAVTGPPASPAIAPAYESMAHSNNMEDGLDLVSPPLPPDLISYKGMNGLLAKVIAKKTELMQNFPNPFNPETWIPYQLSEDSEVSVEIYDVQGKLLRILNLGRKPAGAYLNKGEALYWDGKNQAGESVSSGIYFYKLKAGKFTNVRKMVVVK